MFMFLWWLIVGVFMCYINDFNYDTLGWLFVFASPIWLFDSKNNKKRKEMDLSPIFKENKTN